MRADWPLGLRLARVSLLEWSAGLGTSPSRLLSVLGSSSACIGALLWVVAGNLASGRAAGSAWLVPIATSLTASAGVVGILRGWLQGASPASVRALGFLPLTRRQSSLLTGVPATVTGIAVAGASLPATARIVAGSAGYGWFHATACTLAAAVLGSNLGRIAAHVARALSGPRRGPGVLLAVIAAWIATMAAGWRTLQWAVTSELKGIDPLRLLAPLGWPAVLDAMLTPTPVSVSLLAALVALTSLACISLDARQGAACGFERGLRREFRFARSPWLASCAVRAIRNPRTQETLAMGVVLVAACSALTVHMGADLAAFGGSRTVLVLAGTVWGGLAAHGRALSSVADPLEHELGASAWVHVRAVATAGSVVAAVITCATTLPAELVGGDQPDLALLVPVGAIASVCLGTAIGFTVVPRLEDGANTFAVLIASFVLNNLALGLLDSLRPPAAMAFAAGLGAASLRLAVHREQARRQATFSARAATSKGTIT